MQDLWFRYALVAMPRTCGTKLMRTLLAGIRKNLDATAPWFPEVNNNDRSLLLTDADHAIKSNQDSILKFTPCCYTAIEASIVHWELFDEIYFLRRNNLADQLISFFVAVDTDEWHIKGVGHRDGPSERINVVSKMTISDEEIDRYLGWMSQRNQIEAMIRARVPVNRIKIINYADIAEIPEVTLGCIPTGKNYSDLITNYDYVVNQLSEKWPSNE